MNKKLMRRKISLILSVSILAAAWIIAGPGQLKKLGLENVVLIELLTTIPALGLIMYISLYCGEVISFERRAIKRIFSTKE